MRYWLSAVLLASVFITGCASSGPKNPPQQVVNPAIQDSPAEPPAVSTAAAAAPEPAKPEPEPPVAEPEPAPAPKPESRIHRVWIFETLWGISKKYYGDGRYWETIYEANKDQISDPKLIYPLQELVIPELENGN